MLRQDIGYFDTNSPGELNSRLFEDVRKISKGLGEKLTITINACIPIQSAHNLWVTF